MSQHPAPTVPRRRAVATIAAFTLVGVGAVTSTSTAYAADTPAPKPAKISASQAPKIVDLPGSANDAVVLTNVKGITWSIGEDAVDFEAGQRTKRVNPGGAISATVTATPAAGFVLASDVTAWTLPFSADASTVTEVSSSTVPSVSDYPGILRDAISLTAVPGVEWSINEAPIPAFKGVRTIPVKKTLDAHKKRNPEATVTPYDADHVGALKVTAKLSDGYTWAPEGEAQTGGTDPMSFGNDALKLTTTDIVSIPAATVQAALSVHANLPGRTRDTLAIASLLGVKWSICDGKTIAVAKPTVKSASCGAAGGEVPVKAVADKGYKIDAGGENTESYLTTVAFVDGAGPVEVSVSDVTVAAIDREGASQDSLRIRFVRDVMWQYAYEPAVGKPMVWLKMPTPKKGAADGVAAIRSAKGSPTTTVYVRPVPVDHDRVITGWTGLEAGPPETLGLKKFTFESSPVKVDVKAPTVDKEGSAAIVHTPGITSWQLEQKVTTNGKDRTVKSKIVVAPYSSVTVQTRGTDVKLTPLPDKDHALGAA